MTLHSGYDSFTVRCGKVETQACRVCGAVCLVNRTIDGPISWAESMAGKSALRDQFFCPHHEKAWHLTLFRLLQALEDTPSPSLQRIYQQDIESILQAHADEIDIP